MKTEILSLYQMSRRLLHLGGDGNSVYSDEFTRLNREVWSQARKLTVHRGATFYDEAFLCLTLLLAYSATLYDNGHKWGYVQELLHRSLPLFDVLPPSPLKAHLLVRCSAETGDEQLARQARYITASWDVASLTPDQAEVLEELKSLETSSCVWEVMES